MQPVKRTRVKICGITDAEDARLAVAAGADAIGLVFYPPSPRAVTLAQASDICAAVGPFVSVVALVVNASAEQVRQIVEAVPVDILQFHGDESPAFCRQFARPYIKALRMKPGLDISAEAAAYSDARGVLLDAYKAGVPGGTGECFDWSLIPAGLRRAIVLAGGLNPQNIAVAIGQLRPFAVDVSGGVEREPGRKCASRIEQFMQAVQQADQIDRADS